MASSILRKKRRRFGHPAWQLAPGPTTHRSWPQVKWDRVRKALGTTLCHGGTRLWDGHLPVFQHTECLILLEQAAPTTSNLPKMAFLPVAETWRLWHSNRILLAACCLHALLQHSAQAYF